VESVRLCMCVLRAGMHYKLPAYRAAKRSATLKGLLSTARSREATRPSSTINVGMHTPIAGNMGVIRI
jgi:hypothetical protein